MTNIQDTQLSSVPITSPSFRVLVIPANPHEPMRDDTIKDFYDLNRLVGCDTGDLVSVPSGAYSSLQHELWIDDEGLLKDALFNTRASEISGRTLVGNAVLTASNRDGETVDVDEAFAVSLVRDYELRVSTSLHKTLVPFWYR